MQSAYSGILCWSVQDEQSRADDGGRPNEKSERKEVIRLEIAINTTGTWKPWENWTLEMAMKMSSSINLLRLHCASCRSVSMCVSGNREWNVIFFFILSFVDASIHHALLLHRSSDGLSGSLKIFYFRDHENSRYELHQWNSFRFSFRCVTSCAVCVRVNRICDFSIIISERLSIVCMFIWPMNHLVPSLVLNKLR